MSSEDFYCFKQKILEDSAKIVSWCPTFDLVLIVSHDNAISLYRSKFQQLTLVWNSEGVESDIEAATWKPNGKELVFGCQNGTVYIVDTAQEPLQIKECWSPKDRFYGAIRYLYWTAYARHDKKDDIKGFDIKAFDLELNLPLLNTHPPTEPKPLFLTRAKKKSFPKKPSEKIQSHTILLVGTDQGHIHIM
ncbi:hypothetical protein BY458DRAFT_534231 [Sporodiniella umbellata]|nr:hypothetical protein BY458DRAFT_534231 [Sporodiniella umbellata]